MEEEVGVSLFLFLRPQLPNLFSLPIQRSEASSLPLDSDSSPYFIGSWRNFSTAWRAPQTQVPLHSCKFKPLSESILHIQSMLFVWRVSDSDCYCFCCMWIVECYRWWGVFEVLPQSRLWLILFLWTMNSWCWFVSVIFSFYTLILAFWEQFMNGCCFSWFVSWYWV